MRERPAPCAKATFAQVRAGVHQTFNDSRLCDRCTSIADRSIRVSRSTSPRVVPGATSLLPGLQRAGEGCRPQPAPLPTFSRRPVHLSPYAAYLAALAVICGT